jgi:hypothetical protein
MVESTIASALGQGCRTVDVFFMVGLPHETYESALKIPDYCEHLISTFGAESRVRPFVAPLGPFLDPGSRAFEQPEFGYRKLCGTLEDHRRAFEQPGWQQILSYETDSMTRDQVARATYDVAERLNEVKRRHHLIDQRTFKGVATRLDAARQALARVDEAGQLPRATLDLANHGTMFGDDELKWPVQGGLRVGLALVEQLAAGAALEVGHTLARLAGRYDTSPVVRPTSS